MDEEVAAQDGNNTSTTRKSVSRLMRRTHMLAALFLTPWITMYALSTLVMHHRELFTGNHRRVAPEFEIIHEGPYDLGTAEGEETDVIAKRILSEFGISGAHTAREDANLGTLTIDRDRPIGSYRVTYDRNATFVRIERQNFGLAYYLEMLHRRRGLDANYLANDLWAVMVDAVIVAIMVWILTGTWMWLEMPRARRLGSACLFGGSALFGLLLLIM
jgi:hypothetical protein